MELNKGETEKIDLGFITNRAEQQKQRHARTLAKNYRESARDMVKQRVVQYMMVNPAWTPEDLSRMIRFFTRMYGLNNRYLPPDFDKQIDVELDDADGDSDAGGTVPSPENQS